MPATSHTLEQACAECKRLKFILSNTKELHDENTALKLRVKQLEQALAELQSHITSDPHPLLVESLKTATKDLQPDNEVSTNAVLEEEELIDTFGSLTIDPKGETTWYGPHAGSEYLIPRTNEYLPTDTDSDLPFDILLLSRQFPFKNVHETEGLARKIIRDSIPPRQIAFDITYTLHSRLAWATTSMTWEAFRRIIFEPVYSTENAANDQQVAIFFITLALAILADLKRPMYHPDARRYYHLSRASISLGEDIFQSRSLYAIQYLQLLATYSGLTNDPNGTNRAWGVMSLAIRLGQMVHRDNEQWNKYPEEAERRRRTWWDLMAFEAALGFAMGRPRSITPAQYDTKMPKDEEDAGNPPSYNRIRYRWIEGCLGSILDGAFSVKPPPYSKILDMDKSFRDWDIGIPPSKEISAVQGTEMDDIFIRRLIRSLSTAGLQEIAFMYLHRRYFLEALVRRSQEPLRSKYALSVLSVHRSAVLLLQGIRQIDEIVKGVLPRLTFMWAHVCLCAIVIKSPGCVLAKSSLVEIDKAKDYFGQMVAYNISHAQPTIVKLFEQAHLAMDRYQEGKWQPSGSRDELATDVMKLIGRSDFALPNEHIERATDVPNSHGKFSLPTDAHPTLFEYMKQFEGQSHQNDNTPLTDPIQLSAASFATDSAVSSSVAPTAIGYTEPFGAHLHNGPHQGGDFANGFNFHTKRSNYPGETSNTTDWSSSIFYESQLSTMGNHQGNTVNVPVSYSSYTDAYLSQGVEGYYSHVGEQPPQDQVWDQFLSILIPSDTDPGATSII
ncbi:hypothetical protein CPB86DRAFT_780169 [Serendipita vermifera]|nr:hypothetical protein CPB86DRAFT_780169 [Serendipita vermifera]